MARLYPCDNCGRRHWGYYEQESSDTKYGWYFVWTGRGGDQAKLCDRGHEREPCSPNRCMDCWMANMYTAISSGQVATQVRPLQWRRAR